jgi:hypothetical protein
MDIYCYLWIHDVQLREKIGRHKEGSLFKVSQIHRNVADVQDMISAIDDAMEY